jgi:2-dehydro-3-deoxyphosphogluconate aldolase/(4S)-4-hydroxy-2-oxoglutarate aldolase
VKILEAILKRRVVPAATIQSEDAAVPLAEAMLKGGLDVIEVTFRTAAAEGAIRAIVKRFPEMIVGAGTVLTTQQAQQAADAGCRFAVAPGLNEAVVAKAKSCGLLHVPGVVTPTEIETALTLGCEFLKFFPADAMGGAKTIKALAGPYGHTGVKLLPTGGINAANAAEFLAMPIVGAVGGSWMVADKLIKDKNWAEIQRLCAESVAICSGAPKA